MYSVTDSTNTFDIMQKYKKDLKWSFQNKDECKKIGGKLNLEKRCWYIPSSENIVKFKKFLKNIKYPMYDYDTQFMEWYNNLKISILTVNKANLFWYLILLFNDHICCSYENKAKLYDENEAGKIKDVDDILLLSGVSEF